MINLYLVRHGQSEANAQAILQGSQIDTPLTPLGRQQAQITREKLLPLTFDHTYSSPLLRAGETASIITAGQQPITFDPCLREFDYGIWDGYKLNSLSQKYSEYFNDMNRFIAEASNIHQGDTYSGIQEQLRSFMDELFTRYQAQDSNILVVSHGMTIKLWVSFLMGVTNHDILMEPANAGITRLRLDDPHHIYLDYYSK